MFLYKTQSSAKRRTDDLILSGRSLINIKKRTGPKTDPCGTPDKTLRGTRASHDSQYTRYMAYSDALNKTEELFFFPEDYPFME